MIWEIGGQRLGFLSRPRPQASVFIARSDGAIDWLDAVQRPGEDDGFRPFFDGVEARVMGRHT